MALEGAVVLALLVAIGLFYLHPASVELLRGNAKVMVGDGTDSLTNPWQYRLVLDTFQSRPQDLLYGAVYSDQMNAPEGAASYIPWMERLLVLACAPFLRTDLMPTAIAWAFMVLSGLALHAYGRFLGWPRAVAFALALAWAFCPFTRARAVVHIQFVGTYWVPLLFIAFHMLARPPSWLSARAAAIVSGACFLLVFFAAHYFIVITAILAPVFVLYYLLMLPRGTSRLGAIRRLALAVIPAALFAVWNLAMPVPPHAARALAPVVATRSETTHMLEAGGAHPSDYLAGDVNLGTRDTNPLRARITAATRAEVPLNRHERTNGIRWSILACCAALAVALVARRFRRRLSDDERRLGVFVLVLAVSAFVLSLAPSALRVHGVDLGPVGLVGKYFPRYRVPNRIGVLVHFAMLLGAGVLLTRVLRERLARRTPAGAALALALPALMVLDYAPLNAMPLAAIRPPRTDLEAGGPCGSGMTVPYVTWGFRDEDYYEVLAELRSTQCKILHTSYLTREDEVMRLGVSVPTFSDIDRAQAERVARCAGASWVLFRLDASGELKRPFCEEMGFTVILGDGDGCRAPFVANAAELPKVRSLRECVDELGITGAPRSK